MPYPVDVSVQGDLVEMAGQVFERLEVVLWQLMYQALQLQHAALPRLYTVGIHKRLVQVC